MAQRKDADSQGWHQEYRDLLRGLAAGTIVGMPLMYTMEMWWHGMIGSPGHLLILLAVMLGVNVVLCYFSGFRSGSTLPGAVIDGLSAVGMGIAFSFIVLLLLRQINLTEWRDLVGQVVIQAMPMGIGISFANTQIGNKDREGDDHKKPGELSAEHRLDAQLWRDLRDVGVTISGATIFAFNIAPTEEVLTIAQRLPGWQCLLVMVASLWLCYVILFASKFRKYEVYVDSLFQHPFSETALAYAQTLVVCAVLLYLVGMNECTQTWPITFKSTVVLALPGVVGGSAGRLIT